MARVHRISEEFFDDSFGLIALHSNMECYALAYNINKAAKIMLERSEDDLEIETSHYPLFEFKDDINGEEWYLMGNVVQEVEDTSSLGLFENSTTLKLNYLLKERKEINYLLKLYPEDTTAVSDAIRAIRTIPKVSMAYELNPDQLKSKRNLIF